MAPCSRRPRARTLAAVTAAAGLLLTGCQAGSTAAPTDVVGDEPVQALASFYPLQLVLERVGGERVEVSSLTPPGAEPHDVELSPAQVATLSDADLVVYLSGFQAAVDEAVAETQPANVVDVAEGASLLPTGEHDEDHGDEPADEHADEGNGDEEGEHDHSGLDPHFWLDPTRLAAVVPEVESHLAEADPAGADEFAANAEALTEELTALDTEYRDGLASCEQDTFVTSHEAFGYLASAYGLHQVGISGIDPEAEPSPARLAEVEQVVRDENVSTIFFETLVSPKVAQTLADDLGVGSAVLDPIEGIAEDGADYFSVARANLEALRVALSCS